MDGCQVGGLISVVFSDNYFSKMEDILAPIKPHFYKRYVYDKYI